MDPDQTELRDAVEELAACLAHEPADAPSHDDRARRQIERCAQRARELSIPAEQFLVLFKRILGTRLDLREELQDRLSTSPKWTRREHLVSWAIAAYYAEPGHASDPGPR